MRGPRIQIPELQGFEAPTTPDELEAALRKLPEDMRQLVVQQKPLIMLNRRTDQAAFLRQRDDGAWEIEILDLKRQQRRLFRP